MSADGLSPGVSVINCQLGVFSRPLILGPPRPPHEGISNDIWPQIKNKRSQRRRRRTGFSAFSCSSNSTLCSNSVQPIIFRPVISACWDSGTPPVFQGYFSLRFLWQICGKSTGAAPSVFLCHSTRSNSCAATFPQTLLTEALAVFSIRLVINSVWISLGQWDFAIVSLFVMVQRDNTTQQTPTTHPFIGCHHYGKWRSYFWVAPPLPHLTLLSPSLCVWRCTLCSQPQAI